MQFVQHQWDCNQLKHNSLPVLFIALVSLPSKIRKLTKSRYFPGSGRQSRTPVSLYHSEGHRPCWHYQLLSGLSTPPHSLFPLKLKKKSESNHVSNYALDLACCETFERLSSGLVPVTDYWQLPQLLEYGLWISKPCNRLLVGNVSRRTPLSLCCFEVVTGFPYRVQAPESCAECSDPGLTGEVST